jgi:hypothetical protein
VAQQAVEQLALGVVCRELLVWHVGVGLGGWLGGVSQAGVQGNAACHAPGGGALCMGWATMLCDVVGQGELFCVGGSVVAGGLEPLG